MAELGVPARHIVVVGVNHRTAPIERRERAAVPMEEIPDLVGRLRRECGAREAAVLSTCNRVEFYAGLDQLNGAVGRLRSVLADRARLDSRDAACGVYAHPDPLSVGHLFRVASGLDSMVIGEGEILGQVRQAYEAARTCGGTGKVLNVLFQRALNAAKAARSESGLACRPRSIGAVAVDLAGKVFGRLQGRHVLLIGAGEIGTQTLSRLASRGVRDIHVANRTFARAWRASQVYNGTAVPLDAVERELAGTDILITAASSPGLVTAWQLARVMRARRGRLLCVIDLGVPRNVEPGAGALEHVYMFNVDDLNGFLARQAAEHDGAIERSQALLIEKASRFLAWWHAERDACGSWSSAPAAAR
ncbi:MAG TPA: glutamyl-tRNA reductase [bacterium]